MKIEGRSQSRKISMIQMAIKMKTDLHTLKKNLNNYIFSLEFISRIFTLYSHFIFCDLIFLSLSHRCCLIKMLFEFWLCGDSCSWNNLEKQEDISKLFLYLYVWEYICMNAIMCTWPMVENIMCKNCCFFMLRAAIVKSNHEIIFIIFT